MNEVKIFEQGGKLHVQSPYNPDFPESARALGGKWNGKTWSFDTRDESRVRDVCLSIYGIDGRETTMDTVNVRLYMDRVGTRATDNQTVWRFGRQILARNGRDRQVALGSGVVIISGGFHRSGGSAKYPKVGDATTGTVLEIRDIPRSLVESDEGEDFEIVNDPVSEKPESVTVELTGTALEFLRRARENSPGLTDGEIITAALNLYDMNFSVSS